MAGYQRKTAFAPARVLEEAAAILPDILGLAQTREGQHEVTWSGEEGTVTLSVHRHGPYTDVVAQTDRLRTSRMDYEIQKFLNRLPYEPGDQGGPGSGEPS